jgi:threonine synthase
MANVSHLACVSCGAAYAMDADRYLCADCGPVQGTLDVVYDDDRVRTRLSRATLAESGDFSQWRYWDMLPLADRALVPPLRIGWTPLYRGGRLGRDLGMEELWLKDDTGNPSGSLKDRASMMAAVRAVELGKTIVAGASTGNAGTSLASACAYLGIDAYVFVPEQIPRAKLAQLLIYGATVIQVDGSYDQCFDLAAAACARWGWYSRNTAVNPVLSEGKKTAAVEVCEQLDWRAPDTVFCAVGDGSVFGGLHKGFADALRFGLIDRMPRLIGVQAAGAAPLVAAFENGLPAIRPQGAETLADSIRVGVPRDQIKALRAARETGGAFVAVSDADILRAQGRLAATTGLFVEPAAAAALAGAIAMKDRGQLETDERAVVILTGHGLKDIDSAMTGVETAPIRVPPDLDAIASELEARSKQ